MGALPPCEAVDVLSPLLPTTEVTAAALGLMGSDPAAVVVGTTEGRTSATRGAAVETIVVLGTTGPGPSGNSEGPVMRVPAVWIAAATARLLAMLDMPELRRDDTLWTMALALAGSIVASPIASDATAARIEDPRSATPSDVEASLVLAGAAWGGHT